MREKTMSIKQNVKELLDELPAGIQLLAAAKTMDASKVMEAIDAGVKIIGENYIQEAEVKYNVIGNRVKWHFIGHLQNNKVKKAVSIFDMIETVDSAEIASAINKRCIEIGKIMPVLIEINSGAEEQKSGVLPENAASVIKEISRFSGIKVMGLMTMGPLAGKSEESRPCFIKTREIFELVKSLDLPGVEMKYLSMGMTNSYKIAIEEGANIVRIGSKIFGQRKI
jgi:pyridoxal phosphate enzyme (YggS family)